MKCTFFVLGWVADRYPELLRTIASKGHDIGCHSHHHQLVYKNSKEHFEADLISATHAIERASGVRPTAYRAPGFSIRKSESWAFRILAQHGYKTDCSIFPAPRSHGGMRGFQESSPCKIVCSDGSSVLCFPINFRSVLGLRYVYSGGGYFRIFPYKMIERLFLADSYVMTYFHPRDFDDGQPIMPGMSAVRRFKTYVGLSAAREKLKRLLVTFDFLPLSEALKVVESDDYELRCVNVSDY